MDTETTWYSINPSDVEGRAWTQTGADLPFGRIPERVKESLPDVWKHGKSATGMCVFFSTNSTTFRVRYTLASEQLGEPNFNTTAFSGVDLYLYDTRENRWRWAAAMPQSALKDTHPEGILLTNIPQKTRRARLYLPLRNPLLKLEIGVDAGAHFEVTPPRSQPPLVYYGTSIVHGAYATRSGLGVAQILGRRLDLPLVNLGFSGSARMEKEMAHLLAELNPRLFLVDPYHNMSPESIRNNTEIFLDILCSARPETPVFLLGAPPHLHAWLKPEFMASEAEKVRLYTAICRKLRRKHPHLHYLKGKNFYGSDEVSLDGVHPNDDAFAHMAKILDRSIRKRLPDLQ